MTETDMAYCGVPGEGPSWGHSAGRGQRLLGRGGHTQREGTRQRDWEPVGEALQRGRPEWAKASRSRESSKPGRGG